MLLLPFLSGFEMETDVFGGGGHVSNDSQKNMCYFSQVVLGKPLLDLGNIW